MRFLSYRKLTIGCFENASNLKAHLTETTAKGWWIYRPDAVNPMRFCRPNGEVIEPAEFITDLGTIPKVFRIGRLLQPDSLPAVALIHDWLVRQNNCNVGTYSFAQSNLIQQEALKTWMEEHPKDRSILLFHISRWALMTKRSRRGWDFRFQNCPPTLDDILQARRRI